MHEIFRLGFRMKWQLFFHEHLLVKLLTLVKQCKWLMQLKLTLGHKLILDSYWIPLVKIWKKKKPLCSPIFQCRNFLGKAWLKWQFSYVFLKKKIKIGTLSVQIFWNIITPSKYVCLKHATLHSCSSCWNLFNKRKIFWFWGDLIPWIAFGIPTLSSSSDDVQAFTWQSNNWCTDK